VQPLEEKGESGLSQKTDQWNVPDSLFQGKNRCEGLLLIDQKYNPKGVIEHIGKSLLPTDEELPDVFERAKLWNGVFRQVPVKSGFLHPEQVPWDIPYHDDRKYHQGELDGHLSLVTEAYTTSYTWNR
jgi:hypothetical protein